jgi:hypothetical protein
VYRSGPAFVCWPPALEQPPYRVRRAYGFGVEDAHLPGRFRSSDRQVNAHGRAANIPRRSRACRGRLALTFAEVGPPPLPVFLPVLDSAGRISSFVMKIFVFQTRFSYRRITRNLEIAAPEAESGIVHRVVDVWIALYPLGWQIVGKIRVPVVPGQRGVDVAAHISSTSPRFRWRGHRVAATERSVEPTLSVPESRFRENCSRFKYPSRDLAGCNRVRGPTAHIRQKLETGK